MILIFNYVQLLFHKCYKINPNCAVSFKNSPNKMKQNKETIYSINKKDYKSFQYTARDTLIQKGRGKNPERVIKNKSFINKYK